MRCCQSQGWADSRRREIKANQEYTHAAAAEREKAAAFVFLILHPGQRGEGSSGVATGAVHLIILVFSLFLLSIQLRGQKSNCQ